jgi:hypothetical protein
VAITTLGGWHLVDLDAQRIIGPTLPKTSLPLASIGGNGAVHIFAGVGDNAIWNLDPAHVRAVACTLAGRNLTTAEPTQVSV